MIQIVVRNQNIRCVKSWDEHITTGLVGKEVFFEFPDEWASYSKTAVFTAGDVTKDKVLAGNQTTIPPECLIVGEMLRIGVFATDGTVQTPTIYTKVGRVEPGADPSGDESTDPTPAVWAQLQAMIGDLGQLTTEAKANLVAAINEAAKTGSSAAGTMSMRVDGGYIQYSADEGKTWLNLITLAELTGPAGPAGEKGDQGEQGPQGIPGPAYELTEADKQEIVEDVLAEMPNSGQSLNPVAKTDEMTQPVGVDEQGRLWTAPTSGGSADSDGTEEEVSDTLLGTLPMTISEPNCYLLSATDATISTGDGAEQLLDFESNTTFSLPIAAYCHAEYEVKGKNTISVSFEDIDGIASVFFDTTNVEAGKTYTLFAKYETEAPIGGNPYIRVLGNTVQCTMSAPDEFWHKTFTTTDATLSSGSTKASIQIPKDTQTSIGDTFTVTMYLYEGELTEMPEGTTFDILANTKYNLDGYTGSTLSAVNGETVEVYQTNASGAENETDNGGVIFFGDSIFDYSDVTSRYATKTGKSVLDCAVGGTRMSGSRDSTDGYYPYDMANIADAIANGDFSAQTRGGKNANFTVLASANIANYKAIVLEFGTNDFTAKVPFNGDAVTTIEGALKHILTTILTAYPNMRIVVLSTLRYVTVGSGNESGVPDHDDGTVWGMNEVIKRICESDDFCVPFVDMYHAMGQNALTRATLTSDGVHLMNPPGCKRYADILTAKLNDLGI